MKYKLISIKNKPIFNSNNLFNNTLLWKIGFVTIRLKGNLNKKKYKVYFLEENKKIYIKPFKLYYEFEFEYIFNLKSKCENYDENKIMEL